MKQEHEPANPDILEVAPGVLRLQLPIELPGLAHVNTYAILDGDGVAIVDPGVPGPESWGFLLQRMADADFSVRHVHSVFVTHSHPDHFGNAARLATEAGATLVTHRAFRTMFDPRHVCTIDDCDDDSHPHSDTGQEPLPTDPTAFGSALPWKREAWEGPKRADGKPHRHRTEMLAERGWPLPKPDRRVRNGDELQLGGRTWRAVHTPGHTLDHLCLWDPEAGTFLSGDHVLPTITPHISGLAMGADPLRAFFASLDMVAALPGVTTVLPAHGHPFHDLPARVDAIKDHHRDRLEKLVEVSSTLRWETVEEYSHHLFREERWGQMAESETYAHLEHLRLNGTAERREDEQGRVVYRVLATI